MSEDDKMRNHALLQVQQQAYSFMESARMLGMNAFKGQGHSFAFQAACGTFNYLAGLIFLEQHSAEEITRLNSLAGASQWSFAALDIPADEIMMHALTIARALTTAIEMRKASDAGTPQGDFYQLNLLIRDAARDAVRLVGEANASPNVRNLAGQSDEQIVESCEENQKMNDLLYSEPAGRA